MSSTQYTCSCVYIKLNKLLSFSSLSTRIFNLLWKKLSKFILFYFIFFKEGFFFLIVTDNHLELYLKSIGKAALKTNKQENLNERHGKIAVGTCGSAQLW